MRKVMWFSIGFGLGCALCVYGRGLEVSLLLPALGLGTAVLVGLLGRRFPRFRVAAGILAGFGAAVLWASGFENVYLSTAAALDGMEAQAVITAQEDSFQTDYGLGVDGRMVLEGKSYAVRVYLEAGEEIPAGTTLQGTFRFRLTTPAGEAGGTSHAGKGIFLLVYQKGDVVLGQTEDTTVFLWAACLRRQIVGILRQCIPEDAYPFAKALLLGDTTELPYGVDSSLKISGIRHVAAVSGLHVSILFTMLNTVMLHKRFLSALLGLPALFVIAALAGFTPSVNRACIMCGLMLLALLLDREYDGPTALGVAVLAMLAANPYSVASVSLQLSTASVAGIFLFTPPIHNAVAGWLGDTKGKGPKARCKRWFAASVSTSVGAMALTTPLCAWYFGMVSLVGVVTNLLTLWVISFVFYGLMAACVVFLLNQTAGLLLGRLSGLLIRYILLVAKTMAALPLACVYTDSAYIVLWIVFVYVLLAVFLLQRKQPQLLLGCILMGLWVALGCSWAEPLLWGTSITVLDVGQGQCILLQSGGKSFLVDCGGENGKAAADLAADRLLSQGISRLDGLILTHMDQDHTNGAQYLLSRIHADVVILPPVETNLQAERMIFVDSTLVLSWETGQMTVFGEKLQESGNENSLCILLDTEKCDILITGDRDASGERRLMDSGSLSKVDVLVAGHHGSNTSTSQLLLETVRPDIVCISVGKGNLYGHPGRETLGRLHQLGCQVYRTDIHGTITIRR